jgi:hypothetical protein
MYATATSAGIVEAGNDHGLTAKNHCFTVAMLQIDISFSGCKNTQKKSNCGWDFLNTNLANNGVW